MANTLKDLAASVKIVDQEALEKSLRELKAYIDAQDAAGGSSAGEAVQHVQDQLNALMGTGDATQLIDTFNEIKAFLADYDNQDTLKSLIDAVNTAIGTEQTRAETAEGSLSTAIGNEATRAQNAESALSGRITTLENASVMTAAEAKILFDSVFSPSSSSN